MDLPWISTDLTATFWVFVSAAVIYLTVIIFTRIAGLRTFSKMSSFDFAMTVAVGSLIASTIIAKDPPLMQSIVALLSLYVLQITVGWLRRISQSFSFLVDNQPILLMKGAEMLEANMKKAKVTQADIMAKLREANVSQLQHVQAVVMETTGDISVIHHKDGDQPMDEDLLFNVAGKNSR